MSRPPSQLAQTVPLKVYPGGVPGGPPRPTAPSPAAPPPPQAPAAHQSGQGWGLERTMPLKTQAGFGVSAAPPSPPPVAPLYEPQHHPQQAYQEPAQAYAPPAQQPQPQAYSHPVSYQAPAPAAAAPSSESSKFTTFMALGAIVLSGLSLAIGVVLVMQFQGLSEQVRSLNTRMEQQLLSQPWRDELASMRRDTAAKIEEISKLRGEIPLIDKRIDDVQDGLVKRMQNIEAKAAGLESALKRER